MNLKYGLTDLRIMVSVSKTGSITKTGEEVFLSPSSVSIRIRRLEKVLGLRLLDRSYRMMTLTPAGVIFVKHGQACLAALESLHSELAPYTTGVKSQVRLLATNSAITSVLPHDLEIFLARNPEFRIMVREFGSQKIMLDILEERADIGIVSWAERWSGLSFFPYKHDRLALVVPVDHSISRRTSVKYDECLDYPFIMSQPDSPLYQFLMNKATYYGRTIDVRVQLNSFHSILNMVRSGIGISIIPESAIADRKDPTLVAVRLDEEWSFRELSICIKERPSEALNPHIQSIFDFLVNQNSKDQDCGCRNGLPA